MSDASILKEAFLKALRARVKTCPDRVTVPTGTVDAAELAKVLDAIERAGKALRQERYPRSQSDGLKSKM
jgi:hypothetical protein